MKTFSPGGVPRANRPHPPRICLSLYGTTDEICSAIRSSEADLFEIRLDLSVNPQGEIIRGTTSKPLLFTAHGKPELLERFWPFADYVDVEQGEATGKNTIRSLHALVGEPLALWERWSGEHMTKIVLETPDYNKISQLIQLNRLHKPLALCFASGEVGAFSRVLSAMNGARWTYAALPDKLTGSGQFTEKQLTNIFRLKRFVSSEAVSVFGIIGDPVSHSRSPEIHNKKFEDAGLPWIYLPFPCKDLSSLLSHASSWNSRGFSITHPYKKEVLPLLHSATQEVVRLNSCNTIALVDGKWIGTNTDLHGIEALLKKVPIDGSRVVILGAGSAAETLAFLLRPRVSELMVLNRSLERAEKLASQYNCRAGTLSDLGGIDYDILIHATSIGWKDDEIPINPQHLRAKKIVVDSIYKDTKLLKLARAISCRNMDGTVWFEVQAEAQFQWWQEVLTQ